MKLSQIDIGFAPDESLSNSRKKDIISLVGVKEFKVQFIKVLISAVDKLFERCPLNSLIERMSTCILPNSLAQSLREINRNQMLNLLRHVISLGILASSFSDKVIRIISLLTGSESFLQPNAQLNETFSLVMIDQINVWMIFISKT